MKIQERIKFHVMKNTLPINWANSKARFSKLILLFSLAVLGFQNENFGQLTVIINSTQPTCGGFTNGSATAHSSNGTPPFTYSWSNGGNTQTVNSLGVGTYSVTVTDANNLVGTASTTLTTPPPITASATGSCSVPGTVTVTVGGGAPPYNYNWSNGSSGSATISNLSPGQYCVTVTDSQTCGYVTCAEVGWSPSVNVVTTNAGCNGTGGSATANASGGNPPYAYQWNTGATTQTINNVGAGTYFVTITDGFGCTASGSGTVNTSGGGFSVWLSATPPSCNGANTGSITASAMGGIQPYSYNWSNGGTTQTITGLGAGVYFVTVTDATGCTEVKNTTLIPPSTINVSASATNVSCFGANNGTASATASGGTAPYSYSWSNGASGQNIFNLSQGSYTVTATDAVGCLDIATVTVGGGSFFSVNVIGNDVSICGGSNGSATAFASGGTAPYSYNWSNGGNSQTIFGLSSGFFSVTVTDNNGCTAFGNVQINDAPNLSVNISSTPIICNGTNSGTATANPVGGTAPFSYTWSNGGTSQTISNLSAGTYSVTVIDANGCQGIANTTITESPVLTIDAEIVNVLCFGDATGSIVASGWGGTPPYTYMWNIGSFSSTITNLMAGNYTVTVTDAEGCSDVATLTISEPPPITININTTNAGCNGNNLGSATANAFGGTPPFTYQWNTGATTQTIANLTAGTYFVTVTDANFCTSTSAATVGAGANLNVVVSKNNVDCAGGNTGSATATATNGTAPYSYNWSNGATSMSINNLTAGTYFVTVTDLQGCTGTGSVNIGEPSVINLTVSATPVICGMNNVGTAIANPTGGTPPYSYSWNTGATTQMISNLGPGTYTVTVTDANNCTQIGSATINGNNNFIIDVATQDVFCFGENTGSVLVSGWGGVPPYTYLWNTGATSPDLMNLFAGTYTVTVTDAAGCAIMENITINEPPLLTVNINSQDADCTGQNGSATANAGGGVAPYSYQWNTGATTQTISNLTPGTYSVTVIDANFCSITSSVTIVGGTNLNVFISPNDVNCFSGSNGSAMAFASGGAMPYSFLWSNGSTSGVVSNLTAGTYSVTVTDGLGCTATANTTINQPPSINVSVNTTNASCGQNNGTATASANGGTPPLSYSWSNGQTGNSIFNLNAGTYTVTVTDANGCQNTASGTVQGSSSPTVSLNKVDVNCFGENDGMANANPIGGTPPYSYIWSNGQTTSTINNLTVGTYSVTVTDNAGCTANGSISINQPSNIILNVSKTDETCNGNNDGTATASANGGTAPYSYSWSNGQTGNAISNLSPGTYSVTATDANGCTNVSSVTINPGGNLSVNASGNNLNCQGDNSGSATASANGGTPPYAYSWSNGGTTQTISNLAAGQYLVTVTDVNGCQGIDNVFITEPSPILVNLSVNDPSCFNLSDGSITAIVSGGTTPYSYNWSNGSTGQTISNLNGGNYSVTVTDANNCIKTASVNLSSPTAIIVNTSVSSTCAGSNNGSATALPSGGSGNYSYNWNNGANTQTISNVSSGNYFVTVTDSNGCSETATANVPQSPSPSCAAVVTNAISVTGGNNGEATAMPSGGTAPYTYNWSNGQTSQVATNLTAGNYIVTVTDSNGCTTSCSVNLTEPGPCDNFTDPGSICCDQTICGPGIDPDPITELTAPTGGSGNIEIIWMFTTTPGPFSPVNWTVIPGATGVDYDPGPIYETTYFARCVRRDGCTNYLESNIITIMVGSAAVAEITGPEFACLNEPYTYLASDSGPGATYSWTFEDGIPATSNSQNVNNVTWNSFGYKTVTLDVTRNGCTSTDVLEVLITNSPVWCAGAFLVQVTPLSQSSVSVEWELEAVGNEDFIFEIERSPDGIDFETIGTIDGGNHANNNFEFIDNSPKKGISFYRVKMMDLNDDFIHSNIEEIKLFAGVGSAFVYPNPVIDELFIEILEDYNASEIELEIHTTNGIHLNTLQIDQTTARTSINFEEYPQGLYILILKYNGQVQKIMKTIKS